LIVSKRKYEFKTHLFHECVSCRRKSKKVTKKKPTRKSIFEIYEPSELKRGHFTDLDNQVSTFNFYFTFSLDHGIINRIQIIRYETTIFRSECSFVKFPLHQSLKILTSWTRKLNGSTGKHFVSLLSLRRYVL